MQIFPGLRLTNEQTESSRQKPRVKYFPSRSTQCKYLALQTVFTFASAL